MKFIGIDLGWSSGASGLCCLAWRQKRLEILDITTAQELAEIWHWLDYWLPQDEPGLVAVDAPTIITNPRGMRLADKLAHKHFGRYHAGCYPANLSLKFASRTTGVGRILREKGFLHAPTISARQLGRYQIEVFPHPATINLFDLDRILKYKKGRIAERWQELLKLRGYLTKMLPQLEPPLSRTSSDLIPSLRSQPTGKVLKAVEDQLDSLLCAYVAAHWWYWGESNNLVLGNLESGYIVIPSKK